MSNADAEHRWRLYEATWTLDLARRELANYLQDARLGRFCLTPLTGRTACAGLGLALLNLKWLASHPKPERD